LNESNLLYLYTKGYPYVFHKISIISRKRLILGVAICREKHQLTAKISEIDHATKNVFRRYECPMCLLSYSTWHGSLWLFNSLLLLRTFLWCLRLTLSLRNHIINMRTHSIKCLGMNEIREQVIRSHMTVRSVLFACTERSAGRAGRGAARTPHGSRNEKRCYKVHVFWDLDLQYCGQYFKLPLHTNFNVFV
jgi:hypothetical protein